MRRLLNTLYITNPDARLRKQDDAIAVYVEDKRAMSVTFHLLEGIVRTAGSSDHPSCL